MYGDSEHGYCTTCGAEVKPNDVYCPSCGSLLAAQRQQGGPTQTAAPVEQENPNLLIGLGLLTGLWALIALFFGVAWIETDGLFLGIAFLISGITALISTVGCFIRRFYQVTFICCLVSAICSFPFIATTVIGLVIAYFINQKKQLFTD